MRASLTALALLLSYGCAEVGETGANGARESYQVEAELQTLEPRRALEGVPSREGFPVARYCDAQGTCWPVYWLTVDGTFSVTSIDPDTSGGFVEVLWFVVAN
jgi:hypothetical protein